MGITIHYAFMIRNRNAVCRMLTEIKGIAVRLGMRILRDEETCLILHPHSKCESINLDFRKWKEVRQREGFDYCRETMKDCEKMLNDNDYVCGSFTKTQYAGYKTHVLVAEILRKIAGRCTLAYVSDEADYYESGSKEETLKNFDESSDMISKVAGILKEQFGKENVFCAIDSIE